MSEFETKHKDLPFDFNKLVTFDPMKAAIEYLLDKMGKQDKIIDKMNKDVMSRTGLIDK